MKSKRVKTRMSIIRGRKQIVERRKRVVARELSQAEVKVFIEEMIRKDNEERELLIQKIQEELTLSDSQTVSLRVILRKPL